MTDEIKVRSRTQSAKVGLALGLTISIFFVMVFFAVHAIIRNNNDQTNAQRKFARNITCQVINGESTANAETLVKEIPHLTAQGKIRLRKQYELRVTNSIGHNLGIAGINLMNLVNKDGSLDCHKYVSIEGGSSNLKKK